MNSNSSTGRDELQADIVIIGGGGTGLAAAVTAAEKGIKRIILLEVRRVPGGNSVFPGGLLGTETPLQKHLGVDARRDDVFRLAMDYSHWKANARIVRTLVDISGDNIRWLEEKGLVFDRLVPHFPNQVPNTYHATSGTFNTGAEVVKTLVEKCRSLGVQIIFRARARKIIRDNEGKITGVLATTGDKELSIGTGSVIIATGGFGGNNRLLKKYVPGFDKDEVCLRGLPHKGDGLLMAEETGAATGGPVTLEAEGPYCPESGYLNIIAKRPYTLWVNRKGERFTDENAATFEEAANAMYEQPGKASYSLFDETIRQKIAVEELGPFELRTMTTETWRQGVDKELQLQAEKGNLKMANSWEEIADLTGTPSETLKHTLDEYNSLCDHGHDAQFVKDRMYLTALRMPPYYAIHCRIRFLVTHGGIRVNHRMEVLDREDNPIPGLYCAGDDTGGRVADTYPIFLSGMSFSFAIGSGRIAAAEAARYVDSHK